MATKKDMRRDDLIVPYADPNEKASSDPDFAGTMASTLPMAAIFTRNKMIGWTAVIFALQTWLAETPEQKKKASTPGYFSVMMAFMSLLVVRRTLKARCMKRKLTSIFQSYMPLFLPPPPNKANAGSGTEAPAAVPPA
ncbi:hypothetical protein UCDDS831_g00039 [Diplodia seriata]|uniref:Uncharacterized protein n=1 Tax=Diplodia seriata TaxID=420778 RepID=A0A0G2F3W4_9PEZI|nr:hypothetical protein UCDDS831_g00039 [Diplodia seriata]